MVPSEPILEHANRNSLAFEALKEGGKVGRVLCGNPDQVLELEAQARLALAVAELPFWAEGPKVARNLWIHLGLVEGVSWIDSHCPPRRKEVCCQGDRQHDSGGDGEDLEVGGGTEEQARDFPGSEQGRETPGGDS